MAFSLFLMALMYLMARNHGQEQPSERHSFNRNNNLKREDFEKRLVVCENINDEEDVNNHNVVKSWTCSFSNCDDETFIHINHEVLLCDMFRFEEQVNSIFNYN